MHSEDNAKPSSPDAIASGLSPIHTKRRLRHQFKITFLVAIFCAAMMITVVTVKPVQDAEAIAPLIIGGIILASFIAGYITSNYLNAKGNTAGGGVSASDYMTMLAHNKADMYTAQDAHVQQVVSDIALMKSLYVQRANLEAYNYWRAQETAGQAHNWDVNAALYSQADSDYVLKEFINATWSASQLFDAIWQSNSAMGSTNSIKNYNEVFTGTYADAKIQLGNSGGVNTDNYPYYWVEHGYKYREETINNPFLLDNKTVLIFTKSGSYDTLTLSYLNGTTAYTLKATHDIERWEMSNITGFKTGAYKVNWKDGYNTLYSNNMVLLDNAYGNYAPLSAVWIWGATQPDLADRQIIGLASSTANLYYYYTGQYYNDYTNVCPASLHNLAAAIYDLLDSVQSSAQSYYNWCAVNNPTSAPPDPTWMFPDPSQYEGIGYEQWLIMYQAWLDGMKDWFNNNTNYLPDNVTMSAESLNLKVRGAIYNATGVLKYSNLTIWTPVISIKSMTLKIGRVNFTQPATVWIWGAAPTIANLTLISSSKTQAVDTGWYAVIEEMEYKGEPASEVTLTLTSLKVILTTFHNDEKGGTNQTTDLEWLKAHWYYVAIAIGIICFVAAAATRNYVVLIVGIICLSAGVGAYYLKDLSLASLFKFEMSQLHDMIGRYR